MNSRRDDVILQELECHGIDTPERVCFYEQDYYVLSNFSAFMVEHNNIVHYTAEHAYQAMKFSGLRPHIFSMIRHARSAHDAFKLAEQYRDQRWPQWDEMKANEMRIILNAKVRQHEYVRRKLLATGNRELVENSWRDDFWGWGPSRDGQNMLGKLWMDIRSELRR